MRLGRYNLGYNGVAPSPIFKVMWSTLKIQPTVTQSCMGTAAKVKSREAPLNFTSTACPAKISK